MFDFDDRDYCIACSFPIADITTAVGEPMPGPEGRIAAYREQVASGRSATFNLITYPLAIGVGFGLIAGVLRAIF